MSGKGTPSERHIAPCLAVAEAERASANELILAIVLAYEIDCRLVDAFDLTARGWDMRRCSVFRRLRSPPAS